MHDVEALTAAIRTAIALGLEGEPIAGIDHLIETFPDLSE